MLSNHLTSCIHLFPLLRSPSLSPLLLFLRFLIHDCCISILVMETGVASIRKSLTSCTVFSVIQLPKNHMYSSPAHISNHRREVRTRVAAHLLREEVICFSIFYKKSKGSFNNFILFLPDYQMTFFDGSLATNTGLLNYMRLRED